MLLFLGQILQELQVSLLELDIENIGISGGQGVHTRAGHWVVFEGLEFVDFGERAVQELEIGSEWVFVKNKEFETGQVGMEDAVF